MRGEELLDKMELVEAAYVEEADRLTVVKRRKWSSWVAGAACLCLCLGALSLFGDGGIVPKDDLPDDPLPEKIVLSEGTTAKVDIGIDGQWSGGEEGMLIYYSEEEMFGREMMYVFRGKVAGLTNVTISFNGMKVPRCVATLVIDRVYQGDIAAGEQIRMLLPCPAGTPYTDDDTTAAMIDTGMEGIFMPWTYSGQSVWKQNGATLIMSDLAPCGLADGMRWVFLETEQGLIFAKHAYPGAADAATLDDIEAYVVKMLG